MSENNFDRRRFLVATLALSGMAGAAGTAILGYSRAWASGQLPATADRESVLRMARLMYPHDVLSDEIYAEALQNALSFVADARQFEATLDTAEQRLDSLQPEAFLDLNEAGQIAALQFLQTEPFFGAVLLPVTLALYMHPVVWQMMGYEGPSFKQGGYLHRGAGVVDWLQEV